MTATTPDGITCWDSVFLRNAGSILPPEKIVVRVKLSQAATGTDPLASWGPALCKPNHPVSETVILDLGRISRPSDTIPFRYRVVIVENAPQLGARGDIVNHRRYRPLGPTIRRSTRAAYLSEMRYFTARSDQKPHNTRTDCKLKFGHRFCRNCAIFHANFLKITLNFSSKTFGFHI